MEKTSHYYTKYQKSPLRLKKITAILRGSNFKFYTGSGVFSIRQVDKGTELLINKAIIEQNWKILDLGCGYGPVGIVIAKIFSRSGIIMTDINKRAVMLVKKNAKLNNVIVDVRAGDMYDPVRNDMFDTILLNPPQTAGKKLCFEMIEKAKDHLKKGGTLQLVARHQKGGKDLSKKMESVFGNVKDIAKKGGYRIYVSSN